VRGGAVQFAAESEQREGAVHDSGLQVSSHLRVQLRLHGRWQCHQVL
jgi:hypothetical protein